jgi:hypothetical protein
MIDYAAILARRYSGKLWTLAGDDYTGLTWLSDTAKPTKAKLDSLWAEVQQEIADEKTAKAATREALLTKLGITEQEAQLLLGS